MRERKHTHFGVFSAEEPLCQKCNINKPAQNQTNTPAAAKEQTNKSWNWTAVSYGGSAPHMVMQIDRAIHFCLFFFLWLEIWNAIGCNEKAEGWLSMGWDFMTSHCDYRCDYINQNAVREGVSQGVYPSPKLPSVLNVWIWTNWAHSGCMFDTDHTHALLWHFTGPKIVLMKWCTWTHTSGQSLTTNSAGMLRTDTPHTPDKEGDGILASRFLNQ